MLKVHFDERPGEGFSSLDALGKEGGRRKSSAPLDEWFALPAMKFGGVPLPARGLEKALICSY